MSQTHSSVCEKWRGGPIDRVERRRIDSLRQSPCQRAAEGIIEGWGPRGLRMSFETTPGEAGSDACHPQSQSGCVHEFVWLVDESGSAPAAVRRPDREQQQRGEVEAAKRTAPDFEVPFETQAAQDSEPDWVKG